MRRVGALALALVLGACGVPEEDSAVVARDEDVPFDLLAPSTTTTSTTSTTVPEVPVDRIVSICLVRGDGIVPTERVLTRRRNLDEVVEALRRGPTDEESTDGYSSALPAPEAVGPVSLAGGTATVVLGPVLAQAPAPTQLRAIAQLVCTLTGQPGIGRVQFTLDGQPVQAPLPDGSLAAGSVSRDDYASLLRPADAPATPPAPPAEGTAGA